MKAQRLNICQSCVDLIIYNCFPGYFDAELILINSSNEITLTAGKPAKYQPGTGGNFIIYDK